MLCFFALPLLFIIICKHCRSLTLAHSHTQVHISTSCKPNEKQHLQKRRCAQIVKILWSDFRLHTNDCLLVENQSFFHSQSVYTNHKANRPPDTQNNGFGSLTHFGCPQLALAGWMEKRGQTQTQTTHRHTTNDTETKTHEINISFYLHAQTIFIFFVSLCNTLFIFIKQSNIMIERYLFLELADFLFYWNAKMLLHFLTC